MRVFGFCNAVHITQFNAFVSKAISPPHLLCGHSFERFADIAVVTRVFDRSLCHTLGSCVSTNEICLVVGHIVTKGCLVENWCRWTLVAATIADCT